MTVLGIDGWKSGWLGVVVDQEQIRFEYRGSLAEFVAEFPDTGAIVVDVPIGMPVDGRREADNLSRRFVGAMASSVFAVPPEAALRADTYQDALNLCRERFGFGLSSQSFALRHKILEAHELVRGGAPITEGHPEVSFRALKGKPLENPKRTWNGQHERRALLAHAGIVIAERLPPSVGGAPADDVLDAAVMAWTARRVADGVAGSLPDSAETIDGRPVAIWY